MMNRSNLIAYPMVSAACLGLWAWQPADAVPAQGLGLLAQRSPAEWVADPAASQPPVRPDDLAAEPAYLKRPSRRDSQSTGENP